MKNKMSCLEIILDEILKYNGSKESKKVKSLNNKEDIKEVSKTQSLENHSASKRVEDINKASKEKESMQFVESKEKETDKFFCI